MTRLTLIVAALMVAAAQTGCVGAQKSLSVVVLNHQAEPVNVTIAFGGSTVASFEIPAKPRLGPGMANGTYAIAGSIGVLSVELPGRNMTQETSVILGSENFLFVEIKENLRVVHDTKPIQWG